MQYAVEHIIADRMHFAFEADDRNVVAGVPAAYCIRLEDGMTVFDVLTQQTIGEELAFVDGKI